MNTWLFRRFRDAEIRVHELNYLFWECTTRCNLHCRHCGSDCSMNSREKDMPLEHFLQALDTIPKKDIPNPFTVVLTGGEPLLRPDITDCGRAIRQRGMGWSMVSNGFFYNADMQQKLLQAGLGALTISLDGLEEEHNWLRGHPESYSRAVQAIGLAARCPRIAFDVVTCVTRRNLAQLPELHKLLSGLGVPQWRLFTVIPIGRAAGNPDMILTPEELTQLMEFIKARRKEGGPLKTLFSCEGFLGPYEQVVRDTPFFCHAGVNIASVLIDGRICACPDIDRDVFSQGSIYTDSLWEVWQNRFQPFRNHDWARKGACSTCRQFRNCLGGGMHNWHGSCEGPLTCPYHDITSVS
jgi:radical SAM enzyme (rSAM/lipoprotein system)